MGRLPALGRPWLLLPWGQDRPQYVWLSFCPYPCQASKQRCVPVRGVKTRGTILARMVAKAFLRADGKRPGALVRKVALL